MLPCWKSHDFESWREKKTDEDIFFLSYCINKNDFLLFQAEYVHIKEIVERRHALQISVGWLSVISSVIPLALIGFNL